MMSRNLPPNLPVSPNRRTPVVPVFLPLRLLDGRGFSFTPHLRGRTSMRPIRFGFGLLLAALWSTPLYAQEPTTGTIRGQVTDSGSHQSLQGVTVAVGNRSVVTGSNGRYTITGVPAGTDSLRTRALGYAPWSQVVTVAAGETVELNIALSLQAVNLAEMVSIGYGQQAAGNILGSVSTVGTEQFNTGRVITPQLLIQGKVAGVQVIDNNQPGGGLNIRIRGGSSVTAGNEPLYVVDGMPLNNNLSAGNDPLNFLNPNDIETMTVLKDASAAAIYGVNAANGVVIITTKKGGKHGPGFVAAHAPEIDEDFRLHLIEPLQKIARSMNSVPASMLDARGKIRSGRGKALLPGSMPARYICAAIISEAVRFLEQKGLSAPTKAKLNQSATHLWTSLLPPLKGWGESRSPSWTRYFKAAEDPRLATLRQEVFRHLSIEMDQASWRE